MKKNEGPNAIPERFPPHTLAELQEISANGLPNDFARHFSTVGFENPKDITRALKAMSRNGYTTYVVEQPEGGKPGSARIVVADYINSIYAGYSLIIVDGGNPHLGAEDDMRPREYYSSTEKTVGTTDMRKRSLASNRSLLANEYVRERFGMPLSTTRSLNDDSEPVWQRFVTEGLVEEIEGGDTKYRFKEKE